MLLTELIRQCECLLEEYGDGEVACWTYRWDRCGDIDTYYDPDFDITTRDKSDRISSASHKFLIDA